MRDFVDRIDSFAQEHECGTIGEDGVKQKSEKVRVIVRANTV